MSTPTVNFTIDKMQLEVPAGTTILEAAREAEIYIPTLCFHPDLPPAKDSPATKVIYQGQLKTENAMPDEVGRGCGICVVEIEGQPDLMDSCTTAVQESMMVFTENERIKAKRMDSQGPSSDQRPTAF